MQSIIIIIIIISPKMQFRQSQILFEQKASRIVETFVQLVSSNLHNNNGKSKCVERERDRGRPSTYLSPQPIRMCPPLQLHFSWTRNNCKITPRKVLALPIQNIDTTLGESAASTRKLYLPALYCTLAARPLCQVYSI